MSLLGAFVGKQRVQFIQDGNAIFSIDVSVKETHSRDSKATKFEIEDGKTISDHMILSPFSLELEGTITDTPISAINSLITAGISAVLPTRGVVGTVLSAAENVFGSDGLDLINSLLGSQSPSVAAYVQLLKIQENRKPFDVITSLYRYDNMWIESVSAPRDSGTGKSLNFSIKLAQLLIVQPQTVNISVFKNPDGSAQEVNKGKQTPDNPILQKFKQGQGDFNRISGGRP